ncbi:MAG: 50S ribosome-binding GTPase [Bradyrhizobiaceae bacterium]|nr:50S ribosome-binding GTPase [Bradyrhizobiaceae bacterium]
MELLDRLWKAISETLFGGVSGQGAEGSENARERAQANALVVWLMGKTGAGKTAIVSALTGDPRAEVGQGFEPCTRTAAFYNVPPEAPLLRFLDTRGLGEPDYDPTDDMSWCEQQSHLLLVVMQVSDAAQSGVLRALKAVRSRHPDWPVVVAQTGLHRLYPTGMPHPMPYPYSGGAEDESLTAVPRALRQALAHQRKQFDELPGTPPLFVPIDFTQPQDGFPPHEYGLDMLGQALERVGPIAFEALYLARADAESDRIRAKARPLIYGYGTVAAGAGAVPVPLVGMGGIAGMIALMLRTLAIRYQVVWTPGTFSQFTGAIGGGALFWWMLRYGLRELIKLVPVVGTVTAGALNAAAAFAVTVATGEAACVWLAYRHRGLTAPDAEVRRAFADGLAAGLRRAKDKSALKEQSA